LSGIRYGVGNLDVWEQFGIAVGFGAGGLTILACLECGHQDTAEPGDRLVNIRLAVGMLEHVARCPPRPKLMPPEGPIAMEIVDRGIYKFFTQSEVDHNEVDNDAA
jgi:hypothetical protein